MRRTRLIVLVCLAASACGPPPAAIVSPSPLIDFDRDRLWVLLRASRVGDGRLCADYYLARTDSRYTPRAARCDNWSRDFADYLRLNGLPTVEPAHLQTPAYWSWYRQTRDRIGACKKDVGYLAPDASGAKQLEHTHQRNACDPYDDARKNQQLTPELLGIRFDHV